jgi:hypothetical protein
MKKIIYIFIVASTFFAGFLTYQKFSQQQSTDNLTILDYPVTVVSLCEATSNYKKFEFAKTIQLKAYLSVVDENDYLYFSEVEKDCMDSYAELYPWNSSEATLNLENEQLNKKHLTAQAQEFIENLKKKNTEELSGVAEVLITGELVNRSPVGIVQSCFYIKVKDIKQISPIKVINVFEERKKARQNLNSV